MKIMLNILAALLTGPVALLALVSSSSKGSFSFSPALWTVSILSLAFLMAFWWVTATWNGKLILLIPLPLFLQCFAPLVPSSSLWDSPFHWESVDVGSWLLLLLSVGLFAGVMAWKSRPPSPEPS